MATQEKSCRTCKFAEWPKDSNGRRLFQRGGKCTYVVVNMPKIPQSVSSFSMMVDDIKQTVASRRFIYDGCGKECECYEQL